MIPDWFEFAGGTIYDDGDTVTNPFTGVSFDLDKYELSVYDFIIGSQMVPMSTDVHQVFTKSMNWFRIKNPAAYMALLD